MYNKGRPRAARAAKKGLLWEEICKSCILKSFRLLGPREAPPKKYLDLSRQMGSEWLNVSWIKVPQGARLSAGLSLIAICIKYFNAMLSQLIPNGFPQTKPKIGSRFQLHHLALMGNRKQLIHYLHKLGYNPSKGSFGKSWDCSVNFLEIFGKKRVKYAINIARIANAVQCHN